MSARTLRALVAFVALAVVVYALPAFVNDFRAQQLAYVGIYLVALIGLNVLTGYTGQISLGHGAFMAIGGYTTALLMSDHGVKDIYTIPLAVVVAGAVGVLFGFPAARLSGSTWRSPPSPSRSRSRACCGASRASRVAARARTCSGRRS